MKIIIEKTGQLFPWTNPGDIIHLNKNNQLDCLYEPAVELSNKNKFWYKNGKLHNLNGPAAEHHSGYKEWHINGIKIK